MPKKISLEKIKAAIKNTKVIRETFSDFHLYNYTHLLFQVIGEAPFRKDMCILRKGSVIVSPRMLFTPPENLDIAELIGKEEVQLEARILFFNNYKLEFNENPVERFKEDIEEVIKRCSDNLPENKNSVLIYSPNLIIWRVSLLHYISSKVFGKRDSGLDNLLGDFGRGINLN